MILCDIGNTTFNFLIDGKYRKVFLDEELPKLKGDIYFISVNKSGTKKLKELYPKARNLKSMIDFKTKYVGMGIDRQVVCFDEKDCVVVDAGSAITVDIMKNGKHKGGFILPGFRAFSKTYPKISKKLKFDFEKNINLDKIPLQTKDAITYAMMKSIILPIKEVSKNGKIIFTGGDGKLFSKYFENSIYKKDLIFDKMKRIIDANNCIA